MAKGIKMSQLMEFCRDEFLHQLEWEDDTFSYILVKVSIGKNIRALSCEYFSKRIERLHFATDAKFEARGFYHTVSDRLYNLDCRLRSAITDYEEKKALYEDTKTLLDAKENLFDAALAKLMTLYPEYSGQEIDPYCVNNAVTKAYFDKGNMLPLEELKYRLSAAVDNGFYNDKMLDEYLTNPVLWIDKKSDEMLSDKEKLSVYHYHLDAYYLVKQGLQNLLDDKDDRRHRIKAFRDCLTDKKTVTINVLHDGKALTFKIGTMALNGRDGSYNPYFGVSPAVRKLLEDVFPNGRMDIEDVESVQYGKNVIYQKF